MGQPLRQIVYLSRAAPGTRDAELLAIERVSHANNGRCGVTGLLLCDGDRFIQALEGPAPAISDTFGRIRADLRHRAVQVTSDREVYRRQFGDWSMQYRRSSAGTSSQALLQNVKDSLQLVDDPALQALFIGFVKISGDPA